MDFIMRDCLNSRVRIACLMLVISCLCSTVLCATEVQHAQIDVHGNHYVLSADIDYQLTDKAKEALENGVPLYWVLRIKVMQQRDILWDKPLVNIAIRYRLQYHALLNMYRVVIVQQTGKVEQRENSHEQIGGDSYNFSTLSAALDLMATVRDLPLLNKSDIQPEKNYRIEIKAQFDRDALPLPLRPISYTNPQWYLSSNWTVWALKNNIAKRD
jgi:hypothetical protein